MSKKKFVLALDQGTTSSRSIMFDHKGEVVSVSQKEFRQIYPNSGWVEHDPMDIWNTQLETARYAIEKADPGGENILGIGVTNQRETTLMWERDTGKPVANAIVWQCRRSAMICENLRKKGKLKMIRQKTGLLLDPYFSATKIRWMLDNISGLEKRCAAGEICFGTVDSWLVFNLTGRHLTEPSNASRTLLYNIHTREWDEELLGLFGISEKILPEVIDSNGDFGSTKEGLFGRSIPVRGILGDQQAALFGQTCFDVGEVKATYGTGCFVLTNTGDKAVSSENQLLTTVGWSLEGELKYALEGSVFVCGAVIKWLIEELGVIDKPETSSEIALSIPDSGDVFLVPAFVGLGAPYWDADARGTILGLTRGSNKAHIVRAALESIGFQAEDLLRAMRSDMGTSLSLLKVDGGVSHNEFLMQFQSDISELPVIRSSIAETTALGAAYIAGLATGFWSDLDELRKRWKEKDRFSPEMDSYDRESLLRKWSLAVAAARDFKPEE